MNQLNAALLQGSHRTEDSTWVPRVSAVQEEAIRRALTGRKLNLAVLEAYSATGDLSAVPADQATLLREVVKQAKAGLTPSQAKRIWPRKVAAVALLP